MGKIIFNISGMHCASCASNIESALKRLPGVFSSQVNFATEKAHIEFEPQKLETKDLIMAIEKIGYKANLADVSLDTEKKLRHKPIPKKRIKLTQEELVTVKY